MASCIAFLHNVSQDGKQKPEHEIPETSHCFRHQNVHWLWFQSPIKIQKEYHFC